MKMKIKNSRLVITGMGAITPIGIGVEEYWEILWRVNAVWRKLQSSTYPDCR